MHGFISTLFIWLLCSMCQFVCQYYTVLITVTLQCVLQSSFIHFAQNVFGSFFTHLMWYITFIICLCWNNSSICRLSLTCSWQIIFLMCSLVWFAAISQRIFTFWSSNISVYILNYWFCPYMDLFLGKYWCIWKIYFLFCVLK
jgi:hypothetical protein